MSRPSRLADSFLPDDPALRELVAVCGVDPRFSHLLSLPEDLVDGCKGELMFWRSVVFQALRDLQKKEDSARAWFHWPLFRADFLEVCELAWLFPPTVLEIASEVANGGLKVPSWRRIRNIWRAEPEKERTKRD